MENLKLYAETSLNVELQSEDEVLFFSAVDIERDRLFFASSANFMYSMQLYSFQSDEAWRKTVVSAEVDQVDLEAGDFITAFEYLMEKEALILGTSNGLMLLHSMDTHVTEVVGRVEGGIKCISPSPDGDLLGITTGFGQLLVMTHDWDLLHETATVDVPEGADVSETAFSSDPMFGCSISWRGDGKYIATLSDFCNSSSMHKRIKVWERDSGILHATSEAKTLVGTVLEWMPSGAKIAAVCDRKMENTCPLVIFFERNGLERSSFSINDQVDSKVGILKWNCNSDLLGALVRCENYDCVKVWSCSNNHWYLKHEIRYPREDGLRFMWSPTKPLQLICWTLRGHITTYNFIWTPAISENSTAFVIDGTKVLVTPLSISLMPPPMYLFSLQFSSSVRDVAYYSNKSKNSLAVYLSDGCLCIVELPEMDVWGDLEGKDYTVEVCLSKEVFGSFVHLSWLDSHTLLGVSSYNSNQIKCCNQSSSGKDRLSGYFLQEMELFCSEDHDPSLITGSGWHVTVTNQISLETPVVGLAANPSKGVAAYVQFSGGIISEYTSKLSVQGGFPRRVNSSFSSTCLWMTAVTCDGNSDPLLFGLDEVGRLQVRGKILCNNCSSFSFYSNLADQTTTHLILATKQDLLFIVEISNIQHGQVELKYENTSHSANKKREEESRNFINIWERGAKVVGVLHGDEAAVLIQTIRGNLECIYPRKLVLASIINALVQMRYKDALLMVRRHRIDFNFIIDYCGWQVFLQHAPEFVKQVENLNHLTEFICSVKEENTADKLYKSYVSLPSAEVKDVEARVPKGYDPKNKVSSVLLAIRKAIEEQLPETPARELCIITTLARSDPPALEEALKRVKVIREIELLSLDGTKRISYPSAEEALKHLLWLSDAEAVYEAALGLYDLNLAAMVALNSQKDPKEFLPFLQELQHMPSILMRYTIDLKLHRLENALRNIASAGDAYYNDFMNLIKKNPQLFTLGLQLITDPAKKSQVLDLWGDHLNETKSFEDAATTFLCCSNLEKALKAYRSCSNWGGVLTVAGLLKMGEDEILQLAHELCEELQALGKPMEAARIALEYCRDVKSGLGLLISAREWEEALRVAFMHGGEDLISEVKNASLECAATLIGEYDEGLEKVGKYLARYLAVRQRRLLLAAKVQSSKQSMTDLDDDTASEASSNFSGMSAYTKGTRMGSAASISSSAGSRAREARRQRNRGKIRPGSPGEELALVDHLKGMSLTAGAMRELRSILTCLVTLGEEETARKLQHVGENFQSSQMGAVKLAEDAMLTDAIDEEAHSLDCYVQQVRLQSGSLEVMSWRHKVFISP